MKQSHKLILLFNLFRILPIWIIIRCNKQYVVICEDMYAWRKWKGLKIDHDFILFLYFMSIYKEFRNIVYKRIGTVQYLIKWLCPALNSLYIHCNQIGGGFLIQHGFSTIITAKSIGRNVKIYQQVTIGFKGDKWPEIGDNVEISCGAKVLGGIKIGNNCMIGAGAVVVSDIPNNSVVVGVPAKVIKTISKDISEYYH